MHIGIVGAGHIGTALATILPAAGYKVVIANSRGPHTLHHLVHKLGPHVTAGTVEEAAAHKMVVVTIPLGAVPSLDPSLFAGATVIDTCNYYPARDGDIPVIDSGELTSSQWVAEHLRQSVVVKAFNTIFYERLRDEGRPDAAEADRLAIPVAADAPTAKAEVEELVRKLGFAPVDGGTLTQSWRQQPGQPVYDEPVGPEEAKVLLEDPA